MRLVGVGSCEAHESASAAETHHGSSNYLKPLLLDKSKWRTKLDGQNKWWEARRAKIAGLVL
jgi:hypothetical protein